MQKVQYKEWTFAIGLTPSSFLMIAFIPKELPKLPLKGDIKILDQLGNTVTCIRLDFKLQ
jgi:hypothetical protein